MERKHIFKDADEKRKFTQKVNESNSIRVISFVVFQIIIILYELIKTLRQYFLNPNAFENKALVPFFKIRVAYNELFGIMEVFIILISVAELFISLKYRKNPEKYGKFFHSSVCVFGTLLLFTSVAAILVNGYVFHEADFTFFYFEILVITSLFYLPPVIIIPELLLTNTFLWTMVITFDLGTSFSPYKPYCLYLLLAFCSISVFRAQHLLQTLRREEKIKKFQEEAEHRDKLKSMFLANMSHEIRTPMNAIVGMSELALDYNLNSQEKNNLRQIHSSALSLLAIINDILDFSKIESGKMEITSVDFDLLKTVYDIANVAKVKIAGKEIKLVVEINPELAVTYNGDDLRLKQILINLAGNAAKFTEKGYIIIRVEMLKDYEDKDGLRFSVIDSGQGIKEEDLKKLFNAFQQVDMKANRTKEGTGLGLSISKNLVQLMGGNIGVQSEYGKGSCFYFNLPFAAVTGEKCGQKYKAIFDKSEVNQFHSELRNLPVDSLLDKGEFAYLFAEKTDGTAFVCPDAKILVVDDNETNLMVAGGLLKKFGITITTASSGFEALEINAKNAFDLIFMDHQMPVMDGIETLQKLKEAEKAAGKKTIVIALSSNAVNGASEMFIKSGFDDFLPKPVQGKDFAKCLKKWLRKELIKEVNSVAGTISGGKSFADGGESVASGESVAETVLPGGYSIPSDFPVPDSAKIDLSAALDFTGGFENWLSAAKTFRKGIGRKSADIENFVSAGDYKNFTIAVHALKSSAKVIGAANLSEKARELEELGKTDTVEQGEKTAAVTAEIDSKTAVLLELYRTYTGILQPSCEYKEPQQNLQATDDNEIKALLEKLKAAAGDNNLTDAEDCIKKLSSLALPQDIKKQLPLLQEAVENIDFDRINELLLV